MSDAYRYRSLCCTAVFIILIIGTLILIVVFRYNNQNQLEPSRLDFDVRSEKKREGFTRGRDFYIYNYHKVPVDVRVQQDDEREQPMISNVLAGGRLGVRWSSIASNLHNGTTINSYTRKPGSTHDILIGTNHLRIPKGTTIKSLHVGMISAHQDLSMAGEGTKSTLGTALPRVRIVNVSPRCLTLLAGSDSIQIQPYSSHLYYGENGRGIHLGTIIRDQDGFLPNYIIDRPITDIHMGITSDVQVPLYAGAKFGGDFDDTMEGIVSHPFELHDLGVHNGALRDRTYIP